MNGMSLLGTEGLGAAGGSSASGEHTSRFGARGLAQVPSHVRLDILTLSSS